MDEQAVVARFRDGRMVKGHTSDFDQARREFHITPAATEPREPIPVTTTDLKAVFFVRSLTGDAQYRERKEFRLEDAHRGLKVEVTFSDGETLIGYTQVRNVWERIGFFVIPVDFRSNNQRVYVITSAATSIRFL